MNYKIYCDGSSKKKGLPEGTCVGGWSYIVLDEDDKIYKMGQNAQYLATNQQMELTACLRGLESLLEPILRDTEVVVYTDSAYLYNCYIDKWYTNWKANNWYTTAGTKVKNRELWKRLVPYFDMPNVHFVKVKGHSGDEWNEKVDTYAQNAADALIQKVIEENK